MSIRSGSGKSVWVRTQRSISEFCRDCPRPTESKRMRAMTLSFARRSSVTGWCLHCSRSYHVFPIMRYQFLAEQIAPAYTTHLPFTSIPTLRSPLWIPPRTIAHPRFTAPRIRAFFSPLFPDTPIYGSVLVSMTPCSIENSWSISPNTGSIRMSDTTKIGILWGVMPIPRTWGIPGAIRAPIAHLLICFWGSRGSGVHANRKYRFKRLFIENNRFNRDFGLQFSGLRLVTFFATGFRLKKCLKAAGSPLLPANAITSENCGFWQGLSGFFV